MHAGAPPRHRCRGPRSYSALQMKAIDAAEAQSPATYGQRLFEVIKVITKTGHIQLITGLVGSKAWFDKLPADLQAIVREEAQGRRHSVAGDDRLAQELREVDGRQRRQDQRDRHQAFRHGDPPLSMTSSVTAICANRSTLLLGR